METDTNLIIVETKKCFGCGKYGTIQVSAKGFSDWQNGTLIQSALPELPKELREQLISGTHPSCWIAMFSFDENAPEDEGEAE